MEVLPGDAVSTQQVRGWVDELIDAGLLEEYTALNDKTYWQITGWSLHQKIDQKTVRHPGVDEDKPTKSRRRLGGKQRQLAYKKVAARDGEKCFNCNTEHHLQVDHEVPFSKGGSNDLENLRLLCGRCNAEKFDKVHEGYAEGTRKVREGDSPPEGKGNGRETETEGKGNTLGQTDVRPNASAYSAKFEEFWLAYPKKKSKGDAWKAWKIAVRSTSDSQIIRSCELYRDSDEGRGEFVPHAGKWIRASRWEDDPGAWKDTRSQQTQLPRSQRPIVKLPVPAEEAAQ